MPYRITERAHNGASRVILETPNAALAVRYYVALIGRDTLTVHTARGQFEQRDAARTVAYAVRGYGATFTASALGRMYTLACYAAPKPAPVPERYPRGFIDLTRLTMRGALSIEPGRRYE